VGRGEDANEAVRPRKASQCTLEDGFPASQLPLNLWTGTDTAFRKIANHSVYRTYPACVIGTTRTT